MPHKETRNYCVSLLKKTKKEYFGNLNEKNVCDNKAFWKTKKPFLSDKIVSKEQITLVEKKEIISEDSDVAQTLNSFFSNIVTNLKIPACVDSNSNLENVTDPIIKLILKYRDHPSILATGVVWKEKSDSPFNIYWNRQRRNIKGNSKFGYIKGMSRY